MADQGGSTCCRAARCAGAELALEAEARWSGRRRTGAGVPAVKQKLRQTADRISRAVPRVISPHASSP